MVAEVRDGLLYIFMPPTEALEHFVDLIARIEAAAAKANCPVVIEGYGPPPDPRLKSTTITPDPGVIEVNIAPTASFDEQTQQLETLYERPGWLGCRRSRSTSTAPTAAPAVATTSRWAASRPPTRRCCAARTCWSRC